MMTSIVQHRYRGPLKPVPLRLVCQLNVSGGRAAAGPGDDARTRFPDPLITDTGGPMSSATLNNVGRSTTGRLVEHRCMLQRLRV